MGQLTTDRPKRGLFLSQLVSLGAAIIAAPALAATVTIDVSASSASIAVSGPAAGGDGDIYDSSDVSNLQQPGGLGHAEATASVAGGVPSDTSAVLTTSATAIYDFAQHGFSIGFDQYLPGVGAFPGETYRGTADAKGAYFFSVDADASLTFGSSFDISGLDPLEADFTSGATVVLRNETTGVDLFTVLTPASLPKLFITTLSAGDTYSLTYDFFIQDGNGMSTSVHAGGSLFLSFEGTFAEGVVPLPTSSLMGFSILGFTALRRSAVRVLRV